jgi:hypothetical protein
MGHPRQGKGGMMAEIGSAASPGGDQVGNVGQVVGHVTDRDRPLF